MAQSTTESKAIRAALAAKGRKTGWDNVGRYCSAGYSPSDVKMHCVQNGAWQKIRLSMKGVDTVDKLDILEAWWDKQMTEAYRLLESEDEVTRVRGSALKWATEVQVGNYLGAIRRGGQLDDDNQIRKAR